MVDETAILVPVRPVPLPLAGQALPAAHVLAVFLAGRNARTQRAYRQDLDDFRTFVQAATLDDAVEMLLSYGHGPANELGLAYKAHLVERQLTAATVNHRLAALRALVKLARTLGLVLWALEVENVPATPYRDTRGPGRQGFRQLLDAVASNNVAKDCRDRAMLRLLYDLGLRRGEVVGLDLEDFDAVAKRLAILGKGRSQKERLTVPEPTHAAVVAWLDARGSMPGPLFTNFDRAAKGQRLTGTSLYRIVRDLGKRAGLTVRPHGLRHAAITEALELTDGNVRAVQQFSRHRDVRILLLYDDNRRDLAGEVAALVAENS